MIPPARYILRFDDVCSTMNWRVWDKIEAILQDARVQPLLGVVPDNHDQKLKHGPPDSNFWSRVRDWQARGWSIGMHGYRHEYLTRSAGLIGINGFSEFAGLSALAQAERIDGALQVFEEQGVRADAWVAPAHSFDHTTVSLLGRSGLRVISDGLFRYPVRTCEGVLWVPQQLWRLRRCPPGVWTVAYHINAWDRRQIQRFRDDVTRFAGAITSLRETVELHGGRTLRWSDRVCALALRNALRCKIYARQLVPRH
jgi:predicted deacetylase